MSVRRIVRLPPVPLRPPGACFMCRKPLTDHRDCPRCEGDGLGFLVDRQTRQPYPCELCDGFGKDCPPA